MDQILSINGKRLHVHVVVSNILITLSIMIVEDSDMICQAGARWEDINHTLKERGIPLFFPVCASFGTISTLPDSFTHRLAGSRTWCSQFDDNPIMVMTPNLIG